MSTSSYFYKEIRDTMLSVLQHPMITPIGKISSLSTPATSTSSSSIEWILDNVHQGTQIYHAKNIEYAARANCSIFSTTIEELATFMIMDTSEMYQLRMKELCPNTFIDGLVLASLIPRTKANPWRYMGLKWKLMQIAGTDECRDFVFIDYVDVALDAQGLPIVFRVLKSIALSAHDMVLLKLGYKFNARLYKRGKIEQEGFIFRTSTKRGGNRMSRSSSSNGTPPSPPKIIDARYTSEIDWRVEGHVSLRKQLIEHGRVLNNITESMETRRLSIRYFYHSNRTILSTNRTHCQVCVRTFTLFRHKYHCRMCGEVVCNKCCNKRVVKLAMFGVDKIRVCSACSVQARFLSKTHYLVSIANDSLPISTNALVKPSLTEFQVKMSPMMRLKPLQQESKRHFSITSMASTVSCEEEKNRIRGG